MIEQNCWNIIWNKTISYVYLMIQCTYLSALIYSKTINYRPMIITNPITQYIRRGTTSITFQTEESCNLFLDSIIGATVTLKIHSIKCAMIVGI